MAMDEILIVDDERPIRMALRTAFRKENMKTAEAADGEEALRMLSREKYRLVILDVMMPGIGGYEVLQQLRSHGDNTPVLMLSGKDDETDQVLGLGFGADSYLTKPFHTAVLIQTAKALIRRSQVYSRKPAAEIQKGPFLLDLRRMECFKNGTQIMFTGRELALFRFLLENPEQVFSKEQLYRQVWGDAIVDDNTITVYIKRIRNKIEEDPKKPVYLKTVRGIGYRMDLRHGSEE